MSGFDVSLGPTYPPEPGLEGEVGWSAELWDMLRDGGVWAVPRSGLVFQKREAERVFALTARMPWSPAMVGVISRGSAARAAGGGELEAIGARFGVLGISVPDETTTEGDDDADTG